MTYETFGLTNAGRSRENNEDALRVEPELNLIVVADGMGGESCGEVASALVVDKIVEYIRCPAETLEPEERIKEAIRLANRVVWNAAEDHGECKGMGSTVVVAYWEDDRLWIVNVGDSRAYRFRNGQLTQLSYDQNVGNDLRTNLGLSEEQVQRYPHHRLLTMAVGIGEDVLIRTWSGDLAPGDLIFLCSDGFYGPIPDSRLAEFLSSRMPLPAMMASMIEAANSAGGPDNITVAVLKAEV